MECWLRAWRRGVAVCQRHWRLLRRYWRALDRALLRGDIHGATRRSVARDGDSVGFIVLVCLGLLVAWMFFFQHYVAGSGGH
ncbi:hypothetical protein BL250_16195 [Erwinia sp. OLTSP20]|uniref:hypothetical protein n=1 Tax=unclassified Erwinia TaxID=2622719 RepID=UPI000C1A820B|nr:MULTISPECIES: hypothetical protein [unclassified Erwinia]PIJ48881.1 hypothetical protein BV501_14270 [Erwinia sp. OAMSP11]PIJ74534.1 hypothetical protein BK416_03475 [Erwinia sp. OLSSP12]PIJ79565.1 hypothetical protein BLD47_12895 [Erwinia sp. OLCASP19]PIJ80350.1 hypothetical protein BLD46_14740 [Erwinia sp. OLMTSP26]PIJ82465.1 hypothetical protein BLD49_14635 [Erwinia sp. OLMDSP33]